MNRHPDLAILASQDTDVAYARHKAVDKITSAHIAVSLMNKYASDPVKELVHEERTIELMEDATYLYRQYLRLKLATYEKLLAEIGEKKDRTIVNQAQFISDLEDSYKKQGESYDSNNR